MRTKRTLLACVAAGSAVASALPAGAQPPATRVVEGNYRDPALLTERLMVDLWRSSTLSVPPGPERFASVTLQDDAGKTVYGVLRQDTDGDAEYDDLVVPICDATPLPVHVKPNMPLIVTVYRGTCYGKNDLSRTTSGLITVTLSTKPPQS